MYVQTDNGKHIASNSFIKLDHTVETGSLSFLKKPQRGKFMKSHFATDFELQRNTSFNASAHEKLDSSSPQIPGIAVVKKLNPSDLETSDPCVSPTTKTDGPSKLIDDLLELPPIYKKSGELLKSSLKKRSMSLPSNMNMDMIIDGTQLGNDLTSRNRSKSVHFDTKAPVKYFKKDMSPSAIATLDEIVDSVSYTQKALSLSKNDDDSDDSEPNFFNNGITSRKSMEKFSNSLSLVDKKPKLQKSQKLLNDFNKTAQKKTNNRIIGLYNVNFPILSNKNPKSLKLNIFIKLAQQKLCFLEGLTLLIQRSYSGRLSNASENYLTTFVTGKVLVKNLDFEKRVIIKYTLNNWNTSHDIQCQYLSDAQGVIPGTNMDFFKFIIDYNEVKAAKGVLEFCIQYLTKKDGHQLEYWDNNDGKNYKVEVIMNGFTNPFL